jgi:hypothetical protein
MVAPMSGGLSPFEPRPARRWREADGSVEAISRDSPAETAVGLAYGRAPYIADGHGVFTGARRIAGG